MACGDVSPWALQVDLSPWAPAHASNLLAPTQPHDIVEASPWIILSLVLCSCIVLIFLSACTRFCIYGVSIHVLLCSRSRKCRCRRTEGRLSCRNLPGSCLVVAFVAIGAANAGILATETAYHSIGRGVCLLERTLAESRENVDGTLTSVPSSSAFPNIGATIQSASTMETLRFDLVTALRDAQGISTLPFTFLRGEQAAATLTRAHESLMLAEDIHRFFVVLSRAQVHAHTSDVRRTNIEQIVRDISVFLHDIQLDEFYAKFFIGYLRLGARIGTFILAGLLALILGFAVVLRCCAPEHRITPEKKDAPGRNNFRKLRITCTLWIALWLLALSVGALATGVLGVQQLVAAACDAGDDLRSVRNGGPDQVFHSPPQIDTLRKCMAAEYQTLVESADAALAPSNPFVRPLLDLPRLYLRLPDTSLDPLLLQPLRASLTEADFVLVCGDIVFPVSDPLPSPEYIAANCANKSDGTRAQFNQMNLTHSLHQHYAIAANKYAHFALMLDDSIRPYTSDAARLCAPMVDAYQLWAQRVNCASLKQDFLDVVGAFCREGSFNSMAIVCIACLWALAGCAMFLGHVAYVAWKRERRPLEVSWANESNRGSEANRSDANTEERFVFVSKPPTPIITMNDY